jgi:Protein of unknown function (DUF3053).
MWKYQGFKLVLMLMGLASLAACFDNEPEEREKFIKFLNSHYINQAGSGVADLTEDSLVGKDIGPYFKYHNEVFTYYQDEADRLMEPKVKSIQALLPLSYDNIPETIASLEKGKEDVARLLADNEAIYQKTLDRKNRLKMPDDLKAVYDQAFEKIVAKNYKALATLFGEPVIELFEARIKLLQFIEGHQGEIKISGSRLEVGDPALMNEIKPLMDESNKKGRAWEKMRNEVKAHIRNR